MRCEVSGKLAEILLIIPETEFEKQWMEYFIPHGEKAECFLKCGSTPAEIIGIKIEKPKEQNDSTR